MSALESIITGCVSVLASGGLVALVRRREKRDVLDARATQEQGREETARHKREERREAQLHDECRKEVADLRAEVRDERDARLEIAADVARCEERHRASEARERERDERLERLERRSNPPVPEHAE